MKNLSLLVWLTQLGLSVAAPLAGFVFLGVWLHRRFSWGVWIVWVCVALGILTAIGGLCSSLSAMQKLAGQKDEKPPVSFNEHD